MMIRHDHRHAERLRTGDLGLSRNPVVAGYDSVRPRSPRLLDQMVVESVTVMNPMGDRRVHGRPAVSQSRQQYVSGADAVDIIIPYDPDPFPAGDLLPHDLCPFLCIRQQERIVQILQRAVKKPVDRFLPDDIPVADDPGDHRIDPELFRYCIEVRFLGGHHPFGHLTLSFSSIKYDDYCSSFPLHMIRCRKKGAPHIAKRPCIVYETHPFSYLDAAFAFFPAFVRSTNHIAPVRQMEE